MHPPLLESFSMSDNPRDLAFGLNRCANCGKRYTVSREVSRARVRCPACGAIPDTAAKAQGLRSAAMLGALWALRLGIPLAILLSAAALIALFVFDTDRPTKLTMPLRQADTRFPALPATSAPAEESDSMLPDPTNTAPPSGTMGSTQDAEAAVCPVVIRTPTGSSAESYFVKFEGWETRRAVATVFIRPGEAVSARLPPGLYRVKWCSGTIWHGTATFFGPQANYSLLLEPLSVAAPLKGVATPLILDLRAKSAAGLKSSPTQPRDF